MKRNTLESFWPSTHWSTSLTLLSVKNNWQSGRSPASLRCHWSSSTNISSPLGRWLWKNVQCGRYVDHIWSMMQRLVLPAWLAEEVTVPRSIDHALVRQTPNGAFGHLAWSMRGKYTACRCGQVDIWVSARSSMSFTMVMTPGGT